MIKSSVKPNESELLARLREGDKVAFEYLYIQYSPKLYMNIFKMVKDEFVAEELIQELFTRAWLRRGELGGVSNFQAYLYRVAQNLVHDFFRKIEQDKKMFAHFQRVATANYAHVEEALDLKESEQLLSKALSQLSPQQRNVYEFCKIEGCSYKETAEKMGISAHTVKEYLSKANQLVKNYLLSNMNVTFGLILLIGLKQKV